MLTVSNALLRSMNNTPLTKPLSIFENHLLVIWIRDVTVEWSFLNPDWVIVNSLDSVRESL